MDRRKFLKSAVAASVSGAVMAGWPGWLRRGFADVSITSPMAGAKNVKDALQRGRDTGKPLLVFVVPPDEEKWQRGHLFGEYLNNAIDEQMAPLALAEVACATVSQLEGSGITVADKGAMLQVVEPGENTARGLSVRVEEWTEVERIRPLAVGDTKGKPVSPKHTEEDIIDARIAAVARAVKEALAADAEMVRRRVAAAREKQPGAMVVTSYFGEIGQLAAYAKKRWREKAPVGSRWASSWGCGTNIEGEEPEAIGCGMGHVPGKSARFLYLFAKTPNEQWAEESERSRKAGK